MANIGTTMTVLIMLYQLIISHILLHIDLFFSNNKCLIILILMCARASCNDIKPQMLL
jgi:hypothetical protein